MVSPCQKTHSVGKGETLASIADKYGTTIEQLKKDNPKLDVASALPPGIEVKVSMAKYHCDAPNAVMFFRPEEVAKNPDAYEICPVTTLFPMVKSDKAEKIPVHPDLDLSSDDAAYDELLTELWVERGNCKAVFPADLDAAHGTLPLMTLDEWLSAPPSESDNLLDVGPKDVKKESDLLQ